MNQYNQGIVGGKLAKAPQIKEIKNSAHSVDVEIITAEDPSDGGYSASRRANQTVKVNFYLFRNSDKLGFFQSLEAGDEFACRYWVESYSFVRNGNTVNAQSLKSSTEDIFPLASMPKQEAAKSEPRTASQPVDDGFAENASYDDYYETIPSNTVYAGYGEDYSPFDDDEEF